MKELYISPAAEMVKLGSREPVAAGPSVDFGDFFGKSIKNELSLTGDNSFKDA